MPAQQSADRTRPQQTRRHSPTRRVVVVCLPPETDPKLLAELAADTLRAHGVAVGGVIPRFPARTRWARKLVDCRDGLTSGGPIKLLDLDGMRRNSQAAAAAQWAMWRHVVSGTRAAHPYWHFLDRRRADPIRYPLRRAWAD